MLRRLDRRPALDAPAEADPLPVPAADPPAIQQAVRERLEALRAAMQATGPQAAVVTAAGRPHLRVVSPEDPNLTETVTADVIGGTMYFLWPWGQSIGPATEVGQAVTSIRLILGLRR